LVIVTRELDFSHGSGTVVPVGGFIRLINSHTTSSGIRWSGRWDGAYVSSIPPDALRKATSSENIGHSLRRFMTEADKHAE
ncbi:hypothetical protein ACLJB6_09370, partial [Campylobacter coli]|uniref:hypothetical protein n=1 Tax=Campylobacter coli TaxID=195 RepID=UPI003F7C95D5